MILCYMLFYQHVTSVNDIIWGSQYIGSDHDSAVKTLQIRLYLDRINSLKS